MAARRSSASRLACGPRRDHPPQQASDRAAPISRPTATASTLAWSKPRSAFRRRASGTHVTTSAPRRSAGRHRAAQRAPDASHASVLQVVDRRPAPAPRRRTAPAPRRSDAAGTPRSSGDGCGRRRAASLAPRRRAAAMQARRGTDRRTATPRPRSPRTGAGRRRRARAASTGRRYRRGCDMTAATADRSPAGRSAPRSRDREPRAGSWRPDRSRPCPGPLSASNSSSIWGSVTSSAASASPTRAGASYVTRTRVGYAVHLLDRDARRAGGDRSADRRRSPVASILAATARRTDHPGAPLPSSPSTATSSSSRYHPGPRSSSGTSNGTKRSRCGATSSVTGSDAHRLRPARPRARRHGRPRAAPGADRRPPRAGRTHPSASRGTARSARGSRRVRPSA